MASWLTQSIQRRLLLYFLQKISLFSQINTSTLDVSLGSSSQFTFHDLDLDVEGINIPDAAVRSGTIENLHLKLTVSGGVDVEGRGILFVVKPIIASTNQSEPSPFSLTKTVFDLTNSVMQMTNEDASTETDAEDGSSGTDESQGDNTADSAPSVLQSMRNKALDIALSKLSISLHDVRLRFLFSDNNIVELKLSEVLFLTVNDSREVKLKGISLTHCRNSKETKDDGSSALSDGMSDSLIYSKTEATSIYMSAIQSIGDIALSSSSKLEEKDNEIFCINEAWLSFKGLTGVDDLQMKDMVFEVGEIGLDLFQLLELNEPVLVTILTIALTRLGSDTSNGNFSKTPKLQNYKRFQQEQDIREDVAFSELKIDRLKIKLSAQLEFAISNISVSLNDDGAFTILIKNVELYEGATSIFNERTDTNEPFMSMIIDPKRKTVDAAVKESLSINLTETCTRDIINLFILINRCSRSWHEISTRGKSNISRPSDPFQYTVTCEPLSIALKFPKYALQLSTESFRVSLSSQLFKTNAIKIEKIEGSVSHTLLVIEHIKITKSMNPTQINTFDHKMNDIVFSAKIIGKIEQITLAVSEEQLQTLSFDLNQFITRIIPLFEKVNREKISILRSKQHRLLKKSVRILSSSSIIYKQSATAKFILKIDVIHSSVSSLLSGEFGNLRGRLTRCMVQFNEDETATFHCGELAYERSTTTKVEPFIDLINKADISKPALVLHRKTSGKITLVLRNTEFHYYAKWLDLLEFLKRGTSEKADSSQRKSSSTFEVKLIECSIRLKPYRLNSELVLILGRSAFEIEISTLKVKSSLRACSIMLIDDLANIKHDMVDARISLPLYYRKAGFADIGKLEAFSVALEKYSNCTILEIEVSHISLSLCADSTHTLLQTCIDLKIPVSFPDDMKYRTKLNPINVLEHVEADYFIENKLQLDQTASEEPTFTIVDDFLDHAAEISKENTKGSTNFGANSYIDRSDSFETREDHFDSSRGKRFSLDSKHDQNINISVLVCLKRVVIKLYDGFDWNYTRKSISDIITQMETELRSKEAHDTEQVKATVFDSIYIVAPPGDVDGGGLKRMVNEEIQSEPGMSIRNTVKKLKLRPSKNYKALVDISNFRMRFAGYNVDEPTESQSDLSADTLNKISASVENFEVFDTVPTSTWNKFLTLLKEEPRANGSSMLDLNVATVRPIDFLAATELILDVHVLPLRLHVDQDTLDFLTRFGEFKDKRFELIDEYPDINYLQKVNIDAVKIKLDYKPKKVNYAGLKSGHTSEFMNFFILEGSKMKLKHVVLYGVNGFPELSKSLNSIWMPDITGTQLGGVLGGVAPMKSIVTLGSGVKALVTVPIKEYKRDQALTRGLQRGTQVFMKITTGEFVRLGVKLASGTQAVLENTEQFFGGQGSKARNFKIGDLEVDVVPEELFRKYEKLVGGTNPLNGTGEPDAMIVEPSEEDNGAPKIISLYADQPMTLQNGLKQARTSLEKNVFLAYDALKHAQSEIKESDRAQDTATSLVRAVPVAILRPLIGATEALSKALQGISNEIDDEQALYTQDKYKSPKPT